jgi:HEAT repeat protein
MYAWSPLPRSLGATFRDIESQKSRVRLSALEDLVRWADGEERPRCIEQLRRLLHGDDDVEVQAAAALGLADAAARETIGDLITAAERGAPRVQQMALVAIGELGTRADPAVLATIRRALSSEAPALRFQALVAANRLFDEAELVVQLERSLHDAEAKIRYVSCRIAEERFFQGTSDFTGREALAEGLLERFSDSDQSVALAAAIPLARAGSERARSALIEALNGGRSGAQIEDEQAAIELCAELGLVAARPGLAARAFGGLLGASPLGFQARVALARLGDERASRQIVRELSSFRRATRNRAVAAAGQARLEAARARLLEMRLDEREADLESVQEALLALER